MSSNPDNCTEPGTRTHTLKDALKRPPETTAVTDTMGWGEDTPGRLFHGGYFLQGKIAGKVIWFLIDTECTTNLLFKAFFDWLPRRLQQTMVTRDSSHRVLADGIPLQLYG